MALQIINDPYRTFGGGLGATIGQGLGSGIQSHLEELAKERLLSLQNTIQQKKTAALAPKLASFLKQSGLPGAQNLDQNAIEGLIGSGGLNTYLKNIGKTGATPLTTDQITSFGVSPDKAEIIKTLPPEYQKIAIKSEMESNQGQSLLNELSNISGLGNQQNIPVKTTQKPTIGGGINTRNATKAIEIAQQAQQNTIRKQQHDLDRDFKEQESIRRQNSPYKKKISDQATTAKDADRTVDEALDLLNTGKVQLGAIKSLTPDRWQNEETQAFVGKIKELVTKKAQLGKGVATRTRLNLEEASKPQLWQKPGSIKYLLNSIKEGLQEAQEKEQITDQVIRENEKEPKNLEQAVNLRWIKSKLPSPQEFSDDAILEINGIKFKKKNNDWEEIVSRKKNA